MRLNIEVRDLTAFQMARLQEMVRVEYEIPSGATRACVVFIGQEGHERHIEMPFSTYAMVNSALELFGIAEDMPRPEGLTQDARLVDVSESAFPGAGPVRTYSDGSQTYGPYPPIGIDR